MLALTDAAERSGRPLRTLPPGRPRWAAVGRATAEALVDAGLVVDLVADVPTGAGLAAALLARNAAGLRVLLPRADAAAGDLPRLLRAGGAVVDEVDAYRTVEGPPELATPLRAALSARRPPAAIVFASGSAVRGLLKLAEATGVTAKVLGLPAVAIGPSTAASAREAGFRPVVEAAGPSSELIVDAVDRLLGRAVNPIPQPAEVR